MEKRIHVNMTVTVLTLPDGRFGIGCEDGSLPFVLPPDKKFFKELTTKAPTGKKNILVKGRKAFLSVPPESRFFNDRLLLVMGDYEKAGVDQPQGLHYRFVKDTPLKEAMENLTFNPEEVHEYFICGGEQVYRDGLDLTDTLYMTEVVVVKKKKEDENFTPAEDVGVKCTGFFPPDFQKRGKLVEEIGNGHTWRSFEEKDTGRQLCYRMRKFVSTRQ